MLPRYQREPTFESRDLLISRDSHAPSRRIAYLNPISEHPLRRLESRNPSTKNTALAAALSTPEPFQEPAGLLWSFRSASGQLNPNRVWSIADVHNDVCNQSDEAPDLSKVAVERFRKNRRHQGIELSGGLGLHASQRIHLVLQRVQLSHDPALLWERNVRQRQTSQFLAV